MEINKTTKYYKTNYLKSVGFYVAILLPILVVAITIPAIQKLKIFWLGMAIFYPIFFLVEYLLIKYRKIEVTIDDKGIMVKNGDKISKANWPDIVELKEFLFGQGQLLYELKTKDNTKIAFNDSIDNCNDLLKEIESRTGLKFKQRL